MIGQPLPRLEDMRFVQGKGRYTDDINVPGQVYAAFLRSPHAHAVIRSINTDAAAAASGVLAVLTGRDYAEGGFQGITHAANPNGAIEYAKPTFQDSLTGSVFTRPQPPLPIDKVRHVGEAVAMVIASSALLARDAAELIDIDYEPIDAVVLADEATRDGSPQLYEDAASNTCFTCQLGDAQAAEDAFARAYRVIRREFRNSRIVNCQMEPRSAIGQYDPASDSYILIAGSQGVIRQRGQMAKALGVPEDRMRVVSPDVGGGFGPRTSLYIEQLAVAWAARQVGKPVKWTGDRSEAFVSDYQGRDVIIRAAYAFDRDGRMLAISNEWIGNVGAHPVAYTPMANGTNIMSTVYHIPVVAVKVSGVLTNTVPTAPYRGAGRPEATHAMERMLDIAAHELGIDRIEIRRRNLIRRDMLPYVNPRGLTYDSGDFHGNMERALMLSEWNGFEQRRAAAHARGRLRGIGLANYIEAPVGAPKERIEMTILPDGIVDIVSGTQSTGQGHETTFAQVVAEQLRVPVTSVRLRTGDTAFVSAGGGTHSDRSMRLGGMLLVQACAELIEQGKPVAAEMLEADKDSILFSDGVYTHAGSQRSVSLFEIARRLESRSASAQLHAVAEFTGRIAAHPTGVAVCELEIDPDTGNVEIIAYTSVDDVGRPINPLIVEGQVHGGLAQGIGQAFSEGYFIDRESGQVISGSYMDYGVPRSTAMPPLKLEFTEDPTQGNPLGVKGGGESGITPATASIFNALCDALREFGTEEIPMPATPNVLWNIMHGQRKAA